MMMRWARSTSLALVGWTLTMRLPKTAPVRTMTPVESMLRTSLVAVPAFMRVEPVRTSGPVAGVMAMSAFGGEGGVGDAGEADGEGAE